MKKIMVFLSILAVAGLLFVQTATAAEKKTHDMTVTFVSADMTANTITFKDDKGDEQSAAVLSEARGSLKNLKAGDALVLVCLDNDKGEHQGVAAIRPAKK